MGTQRVHDRLIAEAARKTLRPLGFQQKGRSRLWFVDHGWWLLVVEFQPGWRPGAYLNVGAKFLWRGDDIWSFDFGLRGSARIADFQAFENEAQFRKASSDLATAAAHEADRLRDALRTIQEAADHLKARSSARGNAWNIYHAGIAEFLAGRPDDARGHFHALSKPRSDDVPGALWLSELRSTAGTLAEMCRAPQQLAELLNGQFHKSRLAMGLPDWDERIPGSSPAHGLTRS